MRSFAAFLLQDMLHLRNMAVRSLTKMTEKEYFVDAEGKL